MFKWSKNVSSNELREMVKQEDIAAEIVRRKLRQSGHVIIKDRHDITRESNFWTADDKRKRGR